MNNIRYRERRNRHKKARRKKLIFLSVISALLLSGTLLALALAYSSLSSGTDNAQVNKHAGIKKETAKKSSASITLKETDPIEISLGEPFTDPGYTAKDKDGTDLTSQVKVDASGLNRAGDQQVVYTVMGNNEGCSTLEKAGLLCAVTTENAKVFPGDNPYLLPRVRMLGTQTLDEFISAIQ